MLQYAATINLIDFVIKIYQVDTIDYYHKRKYQYMRVDFIKWYCELDDEIAKRFVDYATGANQTKKGE